MAWTPTFKRQELAYGRHEGHIEEGLVKRAVTEGAYTCMHKPFDMEKVIRLVETISREKKR